MGDLRGLIDRVAETTAAAVATATRLTELERIVGVLTALAEIDVPEPAVPAALDPRRFP